MAKKRSFKRALIMAILSMVVCLSMFAGTTFAWFTDSVTSSKNVIKAGNLDIELYYDNSVTDDWTKLTKDTNVFEDTLWEPGHTEVVKFKVVNEGSLALKYQLGVHVDSEVGSINKNEEAFKLSDFIKYGIVEGEQTYANRDEAIKAVDATATLLNAGYSSGAVQLDAKKEKYVTMVVYMPTTVDNEANAKDDTLAPTINLAINLFATQVEAESDSFGPDYDENSPQFSIDKVNALLAENKDATLVDCVAVDGVLYAPAGYTGTLTLQNSTIKGIQAEGNLNLKIAGNVVVNAKGSGVATIADDVTAPVFNGSAISANGKLNISGNGTLSAIAADVNGAFGIGGLNATEVNIKDITIDKAFGGYAYGVGDDEKYYKDAPEGGSAIGSAINGAVINLDNVTVKKAVGGSKSAGIGARYHVGVDVNIKDSTIEYVEGGVTAAGIGASRVSNGASENATTITITNSTVKAVGGEYGAGIGSGYDTHCQKVQPLVTINIVDSTIEAQGGKYSAGVGTGYHTAALAGEIKNSTVNAKSGIKVYKATYTSAMDIGFGVVDPSREGVQTASKIIYNGVEISMEKAPIVVDGTDALNGALSEGKDVVLSSNTSYTLPSLSGKTGIVIEGAADGSSSISAVNSFNFGEDTTIKNVTFESDGAHSVRYATTSGDVVFDNVVFEGRQYGFHVDNANNGTITFNNCTFYGRNALASTGKYVFNNCTFKYTYSNYNTTNIYSEATFNNCKWDSKLELAIDPGAKAIVDGEVITQRVVFIADARALESFQQSVNWKNNTYAGVTVMLSADIDMKDAYYANWIPIGQTGATQFKGTFDGHGYTISNLNVNATSQTGGHYSSGLFGWLNNAIVKNVTFVNATVKGNHNVGVVAGYMETSGCTISNCHVIGATVVANHANNDACGDKVGVIVGHAGNAGVKVENCTVKDATVTAGRDAGQVVGAALTANVVNCSAENVTVTANGQCTGANVNNAVIGRVLD
ncbi:MAG: hypothetical protein E7353_09050 [Clostridiales bacterium]|nr:hypothetical protein [Clostridiales bacterium]